MNFRVSQKTGNFVTRWATVSFSRFLLRCALELEKYTDTHLVSLFSAVMWVPYNDWKLTGCMEVTVVSSRFVHCIATDNINIQEWRPQRLPLLPTGLALRADLDVSWREYCYYGNRYPRITRHLAVLCVCLLVTIVIILLLPRFSLLMLASNC
jgi:hypothetical protein